MTSITTNRLQKYLQKLGGGKTNRLKIITVLHLVGWNCAQHEGLTCTFNYLFSTSFRLDKRQFQAFANTWSLAATSTATNDYGSSFY
jgi:hypothetical protein